jgi:hypothetical protein
MASKPGRVSALATNEGEDSLLLWDSWRWKIILTAVVIDDLTTRFSANQDVGTAYV